MRKFSILSLLALPAFLAIMVLSVASASADKNRNSVIRPVGGGVIGRPVDCKAAFCGPIVPKPLPLPQPKPIDCKAAFCGPIGGGPKPLPQPQPKPVDCKAAFCGPIGGGGGVKPTPRPMCPPGQVMYLGTCTPKCSAGIANNCK